MKLGNFKLLKEDENSYSLAHPNGKKLDVSKQGLSDKAHAAIQKLKGTVQKFDGGGEATQDQTSSASNDAPQVVDQQGNAIVAPPYQPSLTQEQVANLDKNGLYEPTLSADRAYYAQAAGQSDDASDSAADSAASSPTDSATSDQSIEDRTPANIPAPSQAGFPDVSQSLQEQKAANNAMAAAVAGQSGAENSAMAAVQAKIDALPSQQDIITANKAKDDQLTAAFASKKLDPDHYWANKGTGAKIAAGIGMLLSGFGGGASRQAPQAQQLISQAVENDIEAQKNDQSNSMNLWKMNREALGNDLSANLATQNQLYSGLKVKLAQAANQFKGPLASAQAQASNALIDQQIAQNRMKLSLLQGPTSDVSDPAVRVGQLQRVNLITPEQAKGSLEEIKNLQDTRAITPQILAAFQKGTSKNPIAAAQGQREFEGLINTTVKEQEGTARQAAFDNIHKTMTPNGITALPGENAAKLETVLGYLNSKHNAPVSKSIGIDLGKYGTTAALAAPSPNEGKTATNAAGQKIVMQNGNWVPVPTVAGK